MILLFEGGEALLLFIIAVVWSETALAMEVGEGRGRVRRMKQL